MEEPTPEDLTNLRPLTTPSRRPLSRRTTLWNQDQPKWTMARRRERRKGQSPRSSKRWAHGESFTTEWWFQTKRRRKFNSRDGHSKMPPKKWMCPRSPSMITYSSSGSARSLALTLKRIVKARWEHLELLLSKRRMSSRNKQATLKYLPNPSLKKINEILATYWCAKVCYHLWIKSINKRMLDLRI